MLRFLMLIGFLYYGSPLMAQNDRLAANYMEQGAYEKAALTYESLLKEFPTNTNYLLGLIGAYQQLEAYDKAEKALLKVIRLPVPSPHLEVELGYNYQLQKQNDKAREYYDKAIESINDKPGYAYTVGRAFEKYSLLDEAVATYKTAMQKDAALMFDLQLARIYGEQGAIENMMSTYIGLIRKDDKFFPSAQHSISQFITEDPENEANQLFRKLLLKRLQEEPDLLYNRLLSWLFIQQREYNKAFIQEKAIFKRSGGDIQGIINLAGITLNANEDDISKQLLEYIIEVTPNEDIRLSATQKLLELRVKTSTPQIQDTIKKDFEDLIARYGRSPQTLSLQIAYAHFLAFDMGLKKEAVTYLKQILQLPINRFQEARTKMEMADILVLEEKFSSALIYYSQIQKMVENDVLAQEARFKVAKTSYYKGDFDWAQIQLKVLKSAASQLIANDAQELYLLIADNSLEDSTHTALKQFARADLLAFQNKEEAALAAYDNLLLNHKGESVEDEALLAQARLYEKKGAFAEAENNYLKILQYYKDDILADDATYRLAELYAGPLQQPEKAKEYYEQIIFNFADSIYFVDARQKYRKLRGDALN